MPGPLFAGGDTAYISKLNQLSQGILTLSVQTANFTAAAGYRYMITTNNIVVTLPASAAPGDRMQFASGSAAVVTSILGRNGLNINSLAADWVLLGEKNFNCELVYVSAAIGWRVLDTLGAYITYPGIAAGAVSLDTNNNRIAWFQLSLNANITSMAVVNNTVTAEACKFYLCFFADGTARTVVWPASFKWPGGTAPTMSSGLNKVDVIEVIYQPANSVNYARIVGQNY